MGRLRKLLGPMLTGPEAGRLDSNHSTSRGMSATRSRRGGTSMGTTLSRYRRSSRNRLSATSAFKSR